MYCQLYAFPIRQDTVVRLFQLTERVSFFSVSGFACNTVCEYALLATKAGSRWLESAFMQWLLYQYTYTGISQVIIWHTQVQHAGIIIYICHHCSVAQYSRSLYLVDCACLAKTTPRYKQHSLSTCVGGARRNLAVHDICRCHCGAQGGLQIASGQIRAEYLQLA